MSFFKRPQPQPENDHCRLIDIQTSGPVLVMTFKKGDEIFTVETYRDMSLDVATLRRKAGLS